MTFVPPARTLDAEKKRIAYDLLYGSNLQLANLKKWRQEQYELFWFRDGFLRSWTEINDILIEMDTAEVGQSGKFFASAVELVQLILAIEPGSLEPHEWYPKYEYNMDQVTGEIRMIEPTPEGE